MWNDLFAAFALLLVIEGIMPFVNPTRWRNTIRFVSEQSDSALRTIGLSIMLIGVALLYLIR